MSEIIYKPPFQPVPTNIQPLKNWACVEKICLLHGRRVIKSGILSASGTTTLYTASSGYILLLYTANLTMYTATSGTKTGFIKFRSGQDLQDLLRIYLIDTPTNATAAFSPAIPFIVLEGEEIYAECGNSMAMGFTITGFEIEKDIFYREL